MRRNGGRTGPGTGVVVSLALAATLAADGPAAGQKRTLSPAAFSLVPHDVNETFLRVSNRGGIGLSLSAADVGNFPRGTRNRYLFGAGVWFGGVADVDGDGTADTLTTIGYNPNAVSEIEWVEGAPGFDRDDPRFDVLDSTEDLLFPAETIAAQELFTVYSDRLPVLVGGRRSIPLGVEVRQQSFAFTDEGLKSAIVFQWDVRNATVETRGRGVTIEGLKSGVVLDPDIGSVEDDTAAPLTIDGADVLLIWDADFSVSFFQGTPGFLAVVPLADPEEIVTTQLSRGGGPDVQIVPPTDVAQYRALAGAPPNAPTIAEPGFDLRALIGWGDVSLAPGAVHRAAAAFVFAPPAGTTPFLGPLDPALDQDLPLLADLVAAVRAVRTAYAARVAPLPALLEFPGTPEELPPGSGDRVLQNFPNPFTGQTTIRYALAEAADIRLEVVDLAGRRVRSLVDGPRQGGLHTTVWDGAGETGGQAPAGVYVIRLVTPRTTTTVRALKRP